MSEAGAKVLNAQAIQFAKESKIAIYARSTFLPGKETVIRESQPTGKTAVIGIVHETDIVRIIYRHKNIKDILEFLDRNNVSVKELNILQGKLNEDSRMSFVISKNNIHSWEKLKEELELLFQDNISIDDSLGAVSLIGEGFSRDNRIISETLNVLSENNIDIYSLTTTSFRVSLLIKKEFIERVAAVLHKYWINPS